MENQNMPTKRQYELAKKKAREIKGFYLNLTCYCVVIPMLIVANLVFTPEFLWFFFSAIGWGIGLTFHAITAFDYNPIFGKKWKERKIRELMEKDKQRN